MYLAVVQAIDMLGTKETVSNRALVLRYGLVWKPVKGYCFTIAVVTHCTL
jgi:hypothetical protein